MLQSIILLLIGAAIGSAATLLSRPIQAVIIASKARGVDPEAKAVILTKAFELDRFNCRIAHDLAAAHIALSRRNKAEKAIHLEAAARALLFAESDRCHRWSVNESLKRSTADLRVNIDRKLTALR